MPDAAYRIGLSALVFLAVALLVRYGWATAAAWVRRQEAWYHRVLNQQLLLDIPPRAALTMAALAVVIAGLAFWILTASAFLAVVGVAAGLVVPHLIVRHLEQKRLARLEQQLIDGAMTLASGVRAGLNLVQAMEMLARNARPPISQEFAQLLREYQMGLDLNQAMRNAANRIGSGNYRLLFTAVEMHRRRGGDAGESLDRIADSLREIQRLEGKLDALTAQGRMQAWMMAAMPLVFLFILYLIDPPTVELMFVEPMGRMMLLAVAALIVVAFLWIRRILAVDV